MTTLKWLALVSLGTVLLVTPALAEIQPFPTTFRTKLSRPTALTCSSASAAKAPR